MIKALIKKLSNFVGFDLVRVSHNPEHTLLGLRNLLVHSVIDVGANRGQFAKKISKIFPEALIYCFEPLPIAFKELNKWAEKQNGKVRAFNVAIGEREEEVEMFYHLEHSASSSILKTTDTCEELFPFTREQKSIRVKLTTLDKIMAKVPVVLEPELIIKLDVQGYEKCVIDGGYETFSKARACIIEVSLDKLYENQTDFKDILLLLNKLGFRYIGNSNQVYGQDGHVIYFDSLFMKQQS
ncbi:MAG: FkbM family methyltransferase [Candidatus Hodarchaeota archaeon]